MKLFLIILLIIFVVIGLMCYAIIKPNNCGKMYEEPMKREDINDK